MSHEPGSLLQSCDVLLLTATDRETEALKAALRDVASTEPSTLHGRRQTYTDHGEIGGARVVRARCEMGSGTPGGSASTVADAVREVAPRAIIMVGIAFGAKGQSKQQIGTILVSQQLQGYELQRVGTERNRKAPRIILRGDRASASARLVDRLRHAKETWSVCPVEFGLILSGEKLVDNVDFRDLLTRLCPEAIGGEMEGQGLYVEAKDQAEWILIKAVCDWADGNKGENKAQYQMQAAKVAATFLVHALGLGGFANNRGGSHPAGHQASLTRTADIRSAVPEELAAESEVEITRPIAAIQISKSSLRRIEDAVRGALEKELSLRPEEVNTRLLVLSDASSEMASGVSAYLPPEFPKNLESVCLTLTSQTLPLTLEMTMFPHQQGSIKLSYENRAGSLDIRIMGLLHFMEEHLHSEGHRATLAQPNTTVMQTRLPSCRLDAMNLGVLKEIAESEFGEFMRDDTPVLQTVSIEGTGPEGRFKADSLTRGVPDVREMRSVEVHITQTDRTRSVDLIFEISPTGWENSIKMGLAAFDSAEPLRDAGRMLSRVVSRVAERRTCHRWLYFSPIGAFALWGFCFVSAIFTAGELGLDGPLFFAVFSVPLILPLIVRLAQRQFPYIVFEPVKRNALDRTIALVVPIMIAALIFSCAIIRLRNVSSS